MANPSDKQMLRDANGDLIPQYWDITAGDFKPLTGSDGANDVRLTGSNVEDGILVNQGGKTRIILNRQIRTSSSSYIDIEPPSWARGVLLLAINNGASGDLTGGGLGITFFSRSVAGNAQSNYYQKTTQNITDRGNVILSVSTHEYTTTNTSVWQLVKEDIVAPLTPFVVRLNVYGEFGVGEGIDCQLVATWL